MRRRSEKRNLALPARDSAGIGLEMRLPLLMLLALAACPTCVVAQPFHWPWSKRTSEVQTGQGQQEVKAARRFPLLWNSRTKEQQRLNAATSSKPTSLEERIMKPDITKEFNPASANFGSGRSITGKKAATSEFHFVNKTRTKAFETGTFATKTAWGADSRYATKTAETKESWFARKTAPTKTYATRETWDANKGLQGQVLPGSERKFVAIGRRQADLDKNGASRMPVGGDRDMGQSWSGELRPMSIQDVKSLLNKN